MSTTLPIAEPTPDFISGLLRAQQTLTAVEQFSSDHDLSQPAQAKYYRRLMPATPPGQGEQYAFEVDLDRCSGCKACVVACHTMNGLEEEEAWRRVGAVAADDAPGGIVNVTAACHHCEDPACLKGCPVSAYEKDPQTGIVVHLDDQCIGCKYCMMMCPYEVPQYSERLGIVRKCDMCRGRLAVGEAPACVQACPNEAIAIRVVSVAGDVAADRDCSAAAAVERLAPGAPVSSLTRPTTVYKTGDVPAYQTAVPQDASTDEVAENHWPLAVMLVLTQCSIGCLIIGPIAASLAASLGAVWSGQSFSASVLTALVIGMIGLNVAPLHLGRPLRAWRVFLGLRTSWLSREAVLLGKYIACLGGCAFLLHYDTIAGSLPFLGDIEPPSWSIHLLFAAAVGFGAAGLYSSGMIYVATGRRLWRFRRTFLRFLGTAGIGGGAWAATAVYWQGDLTPLYLRFLFLIIAATTVSKMLWERRLYRLPVDADSFDIRSARLTVGPLQPLLRLRLTCGVVGASAAAALAVSLPSDFSYVAATAASAVALAITAGEINERLIYFSSIVYERMPGALS